jgi:phospholipase C
MPEDLNEQSDQMPYWDPYEALQDEMSLASWNGVMNQLFGDQDMISELPAKPKVPRMLGFLQDYFADKMVPPAGYDGLDILWGYTPVRRPWGLPIMNGLARAYAVSDRWFCSVPSNTNPNRAYSICGTSLGEESYNSGNYRKPFDAPTIFNRLAEAGKSLGIYYTDTWLEGKSYTEFTFPHISDITRFISGPAKPIIPKQIEINQIAFFTQRAKDGLLPDFTYLEPKWGYSFLGTTVQGTDYHPPTHLRPGEDFLQLVYNAVRGGKQWKDTLLIVTFDEHGGTYYHVAPPWGAINPDGKNGASGFAFDLFGVRVPTILISPFVRASTVFRAPVQKITPKHPNQVPFDHTSFIKTLLLWAGVDPETAGLGARMPQAPTFDYVLANTQVNAGDVQFSQPEPEGDAAGVAHGGAGPTASAANALFEGVPFGMIKVIMDASASKSSSYMRALIERYRKDPEQFETWLEKSGA